MLEIQRSRLKGKKRTPYAEHMRRRKIRNYLLSIGILLFLFIGAGIIYTWYMGKQKPLDSAVTPEPTPIKVVQKKPQPIPDDIPVSIVMQIFGSPVAQKSNSSLNIKTNAGAACKIAITIGKDVAAAELKDSGLVPKVADEFGIVVWTWTIPEGATPGTWPVDVTCANKKNSAFYRADLVITP